jgi:hypothetical protein
MPPIVHVQKSIMCLLTTKWKKQMHYQTNSSFGKSLNFSSARSISVRSRFMCSRSLCLAIVHRVSARSLSSCRKWVRPDGSRSQALQSSSAQFPVGPPSRSARHPVRHAILTLLPIRPAAHIDDDASPDEHAESGSRIGNGKSID